MSTFVFGLLIAGLRDPFDATSTLPVLFTNGELPTTGLPAELTTATIHPIVRSLPGINFSADPRNPVGSGSTFTISLLDKEEGSLGQILLSDSSADYWQIDNASISQTATSIKIVGRNAPTLDSYCWIGNECVQVTAISAQTHRSNTLTIARGQLGSTARVHKLLPSNYSAGEDGSQDRLLLTSKPNLENGFHATIYQFQLGPDREIINYFVNRVVTIEEPSYRYDNAVLYYDIKFKFLEDYLSDLKIGGTFKETKLSYNIFVSELGPFNTTGIVTVNGTNQGTTFTSTVARSAFIKLTRKEAEELFNEPLHQPSSSKLDLALVSALNTKIVTNDPTVSYELVAKVGGDTFIFKITNLSGLSDPVLKVYLSFVDASPKASIIEPDQTATGSGATLKEGWTRLTVPNRPLSPDAAPVVSLRIKILNSTIDAFLKLSISQDGSSSDSYDKLIGGIGAGIPQSFFNLGSAPVDPLTINGNTKNILELNSLYNSINTYYLELTKETSFKEFLTNEFILSQFLLGQLQSGLLSLRCWLHEIAPTITLIPANETVDPSTKLSAVRRLQLSSGINTVDLSPQFLRNIRFFSAERITTETTQALRIWRSGNVLTDEDLTSGSLERLIRGFHSILGGTPIVYEVPIHMIDFLSQSIDFADSVSWYNSTVPTATALGISGTFFVIGIDKDFGNGIAKLKLIRNNLTANNAVQQTEGVVAPSLNVNSVKPNGGLSYDIEVSADGQLGFDPNVDFNGLFTDLINDISNIKIQHFGHNNLAVGETIGATEGFGVITGYRMDGANAIFTIELGSSWVRGTVAATDIIKVGSVIELPERRTADSNISGVLIEPSEKTDPRENAFYNFSPSRSQTGYLQTFSS